MSVLLLHNGIEWDFSLLGESAALLRPNSESPLQAVHELALQLESKQLPEIVDVIPAYKDIAVIFDTPSISEQSVSMMFSELNESQEGKLMSKKQIEVPVCYELGLDWNEMETHTGLKREEIINRHMAQKYTVAMMGFIPGFVFLEGLEDSLSCPRKSSPRKKIKAGSVGIGGNQTGIYSLESPGGWNIIGRTPLTFFNVRNDPPVALRAGDTLEFVSISKSDFDEWSEGDG